MNGKQNRRAARPDLSPLIRGDITIGSLPELLQSIWTAIRSSRLPLVHYHSCLTSLAGGNNRTTNSSTFLRVILLTELCSKIFAPVSNRSISCIHLLENLNTDEPLWQHQWLVKDEYFLITSMTSAWSCLQAVVTHRLEFTKTPPQTKPSTIGDYKSTSSF